MLVKIIETSIGLIAKTRLRSTSGLLLSNNHYSLEQLGRVGKVESWCKVNHCYVMLMLYIMAHTIQGCSKRLVLQSRSTATATASPAQPYVCSPTQQVSAVWSTPRLVESSSVPIPATNDLRFVSIVLAQA